MPETAEASRGKRLASDDCDYVRFFILCDARTGSTMLAQALNSHPNIACFREVFNYSMDFLGYHVEGYDNFSSADKDLRDSDYEAFLRQRIYCRHPESTRAVGFKIAYTHFWGFTELRERLAEDAELRVIHLGRRNYLRSLVSLKIAQRTNVWLDDEKSLFTPANALRALVHPAKAWKRIRRRVAPPKLEPKAHRPREAVVVTPDEFFQFVVRVNQTTQRFEEYFKDHQRFSLTYEDLVERRDDVLREAQAFLGVEPQRLTITLRKQNPEPLRELISNYDELYEAYKDSPHAGLFDD